MADYPDAITSLTNPTSANSMATTSHSQQHIKANDEIEAIETELGVDPAGASATVVARLDANDVQVAFNTSHRSANGSSHSFIDQSVVSGATPTFTGTNFTGIPFTGIANGTAGNLVAWSSAGVASLVVTGTATQVLTSNGAGQAPTFQGVFYGETANISAETDETKFSHKLSVAIGTATYYIMMTET